MRMTKILMVCLSFLVLGGVQGCATKAGPGPEDPLKISDSPGKEAPKVTPVKQTNGMATQGKAPRQSSIAWFTCQVEKPAGLVLVAHDEDGGFEAKDFCSSPESQAFLASGFNVAGFNRPGFGASTGNRDLAGKHSQQAALVAAAEIIKANSGIAGADGSFSGAYGYGTGAAAASFFAKQSGNLRWLIVGGGMFDFEQVARSSSDAALVGLIKKSAEQEGEVAYETRSIGYDVNGLPARVAIFRGKDDTVSPHDQAHAFRDGLAASECKVTFQEIPGIGHKVAPHQLRQILDAMINSVR
jgi:pimeloyl-ACP methyl ester carboxylesterase